MHHTYPAPAWQSEDIGMFREMVRRFVAQELAPHDARWRAQRQVDRAVYRHAGEVGLLSSIEVIVHTPQRP